MYPLKDCILGLLLGQRTAHRLKTITEVTGIPAEQIISAALKDYEEGMKVDYRNFYGLN